jgi:hypothetical protein
LQFRGGRSPSNELEVEEVLKKIGIATLVLAGALAFAAPKAHAGVHFGIGVGVAPVVPAVPAVPAYPYAYPYGYAYGYPYPAYAPYAYPYVGPSVGFGLGFGGYGQHWAPGYRSFGHAEGFHGGGFRGGHRR